MIRYYLSAVFILVGSYFSVAQKDKVILHNGSVLYGNVTIAQDKIGIQYSPSEKLTLSPDQIRFIKIKRHKLRLGGSDYKVLKQINRAGFQRGLRTLVDMGVLLGEHHNPDREIISNFSISVKGLYRFSQWVQVGLGTGFDTYYEFNSLPFYMFYKANISTRMDSPFIYGALGYAHVWDTGNFQFEIDDTSGGLHLRVGAGYQWKFESLSMYLTTGWKQQSITMDTTPWGWEFFRSKSVLKRKLNRMEVNIGLIF